MKTITDHKVLEFVNLTVNNVPETSEEFNKIVDPTGKTDPCCDEAVTNVLYRGWNAEFRKGVAKILTGKGFERMVKKQGPPKKDGTTSPVYESEAEMLGRYIAAKVQSGMTKDAAIAELQPEALALSKSLSFDPKPSSRTSGPGKEWEAAAQSMFAQLGNDKQRIANLVTKLEGLNEGLEITIDDSTGLPTTEDLARALKVNAQRETASLAA